MIELLTFSFLIFRKFEIILYIKTYYQNIFHVTKFSLKFLQRLVVNIKEWIYFVTGSFKEASTVRDVDVSLLVFDDGIFRNISMVPPSLFEKRTDNGLFNWIANFPIHLWRKKIFSPDEQIVFNERWNIIESWRLRRRWICCCFRNCSKKR